MDTQQRFVQRAKVYRLNDEGSWDDKGTGHVSVKYLERSEAIGLIVIDEDDNSTLLVHRISTEDIYRRTEDTIISWRDPEVATDLALSFQDTVFCSYIWDQICDVQRSIPAGALDGGPRAASDVLESLTTSQVNDGLNNDAIELPTVELSTLPQILKILTDPTVTFLEREQLASLISKDPNFLYKLAEVFTICEDVEDMESLHMLFKIAKAIISLNDNHSFDIIFSDKLVMDIIGMLEYDPDVAVRQNHRLFLKEQVTFKEAVPIPDPALLVKIRQTYILGYIKDVILPNVLDNPMLASINGMILSNNVTVMTALVEHNNFIKQLFTMLKTPNNDGDKKDLVCFLQEFCSLSKTLQLPLRSRLFSLCVQEGLFEVVTDLLGSNDESFRLIGTDILIVVLNNYEPSALRNFLIYQSQYTLFSYLVSGMLTPGQGGVPCQLLEVMRMLLDYDATDRTPPENSTFLEVFYGKYMNQIVEAMALCIPSKKNSAMRKDGDKKSGQISAEILVNICELLCFCVQHHGYRIKYYVMRNQVMEKVLQLTKRKEKYLVIAAIRFLRTCIGRKDDFYYRYIAKNDIFAPVVQAFLANGGRYNLLDSAVLEIFQYIMMENATTLVVYTYEKYYEKLEHVQYVNTIKRLKIKYDQISEGKGRESVSLNVRDRSMSARDRMDGFCESRRRKDERALDKDEEEYFNEDSDDEEESVSVQTTPTAVKPVQAVIVNGNSISGTFGLVDYEDEDEDLPPPRNNGSDEIHENDAGQATSPKESVWLDPEEDKIIQNAKRKSLTNSRENEELLKRRKACAEVTCSIEERGCATKATSTIKSDKSNAHKHDDKSPNKVTGGLSNTSDSENAAIGVETMDTVTKGTNPVKAHEMVGS